VTVRLEARDVRAGYGQVEVLHGVSLWLPRGSVVALLGPNGAGKSTLLRALAGALPLTGGSLWWDGVRVDRLSAPQRARRGLVLVPEGRGVFPGLDVRENLAAFGAAGEDRDRVLQVFPVLAQRLDQLAGTLSGGEQQMLALCRALLRRPSVLLLDEISVGLAPRVVAQLFDAVASLRDDATTLVLVEQYVDLALRLADLAYVLSHGNVVFAGDPEEVPDSVAGRIS
jgi:branched-chain amino acid transport system ATP-binding protein